jgi:hypothetical protein
VASGSSPTGDQPIANGLRRKDSDEDQADAGRSDPEIEPPHPVDEQGSERANLIQARIGHARSSSGRRTIEPDFLAAARCPAKTTLSREHLVRTIDGLRLRLVMLLYVDAQVSDVLVVVLRSRLLVCGSNPFPRGIAWHAEHRVRIERFLHWTRDHHGLTAPTRLFCLEAARVLFTLTRFFVFATPCFFLVLRRLTPLLLLLRALLTLLLVGRALLRETFRGDASQRLGRGTPARRTEVSGFRHDGAALAALASDAPALQHDECRPGDHGDGHECATCDHSE